MKTIGKYKGKEILMFYCPACMAQNIKLNDLDMKIIIKSYKKMWEERLKRK